MSARVTQCPGCAGRLEVSQLRCPGCQITVAGTFDTCEFCTLPAEQLRFLRLFVSRRGNLREVERELGLSYPTVRARLDDLLRALGYPVSPVSAADRHQRRRHIIEDLKAGEISPEDALKALKE